MDTSRVTGRSRSAAAPVAARADDAAGSSAETVDDFCLDERDDCDAAPKNVPKKLDLGDALLVAARAQYAAALRMKPGYRKALKRVAEIDRALEALGLEADDDDGPRLSLPAPPAPKAAAVSPPKAAKAASPAKAAAGGDSGDGAAVRLCRPPTELGPEQVYFRPALCYQPLLPGHVCDGALEFKVNLTTGHNEARSGGAADEAQREQLLAAASKCVPDGDARGDGAALRRMLVAAGSFGHADKLVQLIRTCYVSAAMASDVLCESVREGHESTAAVLIAAGADPAKPVPKMDGRAPIHFAAAAGHSRVAALVLDALPSRAAAYAKSTSGKTFADLLRENDMAGAARRLEKQADEKWGAA